MKELYTTFTKVLKEVLVGCYRVVTSLFSKGSGKKK